MQPIDLSEAPNFCGHEHWGSLDPFGMLPEGFRADVEQGCVPKRRVGLLDLLIDPYLGGWMYQAGDDPNRMARGADRQASPPAAAALKGLRPALKRQQLTGAYRCLRRGILALHQGDIDCGDPEVAARLDAAIARRYASPWTWYRSAMHTAHFSALIRPVHPAYYFRVDNQEQAALEAALSRTVLRIDPLLEMWKVPDRRSALAQFVGIEPTDAPSWRTFLTRLFDAAQGRGCVGIKQLQAYSRSLSFEPRADTAVRFTGELDAEQARALQDWIVHACCAEANERGWPHQVHVGTHNLAQSAPLPLGDLASRYPRMKLVLIHCWPFLDQAAWLAKMHPNVYLDTNWLPVLNPAFHRDALRTYLGFVPAHKLMAAHDSTSVEMAVGSSLHVREALARELTAFVAEGAIAQSDALRIGRDILHNNAVQLYGPPPGARR